LEVLTLTPLLIGASLSLTSWLVGLSTGYVKYIPAFGVDVLKILPVLFATVAFALLFRLVPNRHVPYAHAWTGALVAAIVFESMNHAFGYFVSHFPAYKLVYGAFASVPIFLMWIYLSWLTILIGAVIAASLSHWRTPAASWTEWGIPATEHAMPGAQLLDAIKVLRMMAGGSPQDRVCSFPDLSRSLHLGYDELEKILEKLASAGMVSRAGRQDWLMMREANDIRITELLRLFMLDRSSLPAGHDDDPVQQWLAAWAGQLEQSTDITLQELFARQSA
jgi:membrane protein